MKKKIMNLLKENNGKFISGEFISNSLGVSRTAVWKYINILKKEGYEIESISRKGYRLKSSPDILTFEEIKNYLRTELIGENYLYFDSIDSTNKYAKDIANDGAKDGTVVVSEEQIKGRGRLGRDWISPKYKGIWLSIVLRPDISPKDAPKITHIAAAAVYNALKKMNFKAFIKWPNDIVINNKKVCGILTEMSAEIDKINYIIVGIGINVNIEEAELPDEIKSIATSLKIVSKEVVDRKFLISEIINNFEILYKDFLEKNDIKRTIKICKDNSILLNKDVLIIKNGKTTEAKAIDINDDGELVVEYKNGNKESIISGEVSVRGLYSYI